MDELEPRILMASELFFAATNAADGRELWSYTGAGGSVVRRSQIGPGAASGSPAELTPYNGRIYFAANDGTTGTELYTFNGSASVRVVDINIGAGTSFPEELTLYNGKLYFGADDGVRGSELWRYDSTTNTAELVADINLSAGPAGTASAGSTPGDLAVFNGKLYFNATNGSTNNGRELWVYDSVTNSTSMVADIRPGGSSSGPNGMVVFQGLLYFEANNGTSGSELMRYSGSGAPTIAVNIAPDGGSLPGSNPNRMTVFNNKLYFGANAQDTTGNELWSFDGTTASMVVNTYNPPVPVPDPIFNPASGDPDGLTLFDSKLYFTATSGDGHKLYSYTGSGSPTLISPGFYPLDGIGASIIDPAVFNNELYFGVTSLQKDGELYKYSGSGSIQLVADIYAGGPPNHSNPSTLVVVDSSNFAPIISDVANQTIPPATSKLVNFTVSDTETAAGSLAVTVTSSNTTLFPTGSMVLGGSDGNRTLDLTPLASATSGTATITLTVTDFGGLSSTDTFVVTIGNVNTAPVLDTSGNPTLDAIDEDVVSASNPGIDIPTLISRLGGSGITDPDSGAVEGIAVTGITNASGAWQFSLNSGVNWTTITSAASGLATLLASSASTRIRFVPNTHFNGTVTPGLTFRAWDQRTGTSGGTADTRINGDETAFSTAEETASITVNPVNDTPEANNDAFSTDKSLPRTVNLRGNDVDVEDGPTGITVDQINGASVSAGTTVNLPSGAQVTRTADGSVTYNPNGAFNSLAVGASASDSFTYRVTDTSNASATATVNVTVTNTAITVNTLADTIDANPAVTSLREAILAGNASVDDLTVFLPAGTYALTMGGRLENAAQTGDLDITDTVGRLIVAGAGMTQTTVDATALGDRVFQVFAAVTVDMQGLTIRGGVAGDDGTTTSSSLGGGILNRGTLTLRDVKFASNRADGAAGPRGADGNRDPGRTPLIIGPTPGGSGMPARGGAIFSDSMVVAVDLVFDQNMATGGRGGDGGVPYDPADGNTVQDSRSFGANGGNGGSSEGGAIYSSGSLELTRPTLSQNQALGGHGGDGAKGATLKSTENSGGNGGHGSSGDGGGLFATGATQVDQAHFVSNVAAGGDGGNGGNRGAQPGGPYAGTPGEGGDGGNGGTGAGGGALLSGSATVSIAGSTFSLNQADGGSGGSGGSGMGDADGSPGNTGSGNGGGLRSTIATFNLTNSTLSGNSAVTRGGGLDAGGGSINLRHVTATLNDAPSGGGLSNVGSSLTLHNTVVAGNTASVSGPDVAGALTDPQSNLIGNGSGATGISHGAAGNHVGTSAAPIDARLGSLMSNGGFTPTHGLRPGSPALDAGDLALSAGLALDQRGFPRVLDAADLDTTQTPDIGALEAHPMLEDIADQTTNEDSPISITFNVGDSAVGFTAVTVDSSNTTLLPAANLSITGSGSTRTLDIMPVTDRNGTATITVTLTSGAASISDTFLLTVTAVNDAPQFTKGGDQVVFEDAGPQTVSGWATGIRRGPDTATDEAGQSLTFNIDSVMTTGSIAFASGPAISATGQLSYTLSDGTSGTATVTISLSDNGSSIVPNVNVSAGQTFTITALPVYDFGDAPTAAQSGLAGSYPTTRADNGARHKIVGPRLGAARDTEVDGQPGLNAAADDLAGDDEDGVSFGALVVGSTSNRLTVNLQNPDPGSNRLDAWIDLNRDGSWDNSAGSAEHIFSNFDLGTTAGLKDLTFPIPGGTAPGATYVRVRLSTVGGLAPTGATLDGEVEDYHVVLAASRADVGVFSDGIFSLPPGDDSVRFGAAGDRLLVGDWNGDGRDDLGLWNSATFTLDTDGNQQLDASDAVFRFGNPTDTPLVGDWNGDGRDDVGVHRNRAFLLDLNGNHVWDAGVDVVHYFGNPAETPLVGDWNGDGRDDIGIWRDRFFYMDRSGNGVWDAADGLRADFGNPTDTPVAGDWDGDGRDDVGVWRNTAFLLDQTSDGSWDSATDALFHFGSAGDVPLVGNFNDDARDEIGVRRTDLCFLDSNGNHQLDTASPVFRFGTAGDTPLVGDWNGDGRDEVGAWRDRTFYLESGNRTRDAADTVVSFGNSGDVPLAGDWNGDGRDDIGVWRDRAFALDQNGNRVWDAGDVVYYFGLTTDRPVIGDWNGDGKDDIGIWREGFFYLDANGNGVSGAGDRLVEFGAATDTPLAGDWNGDGKDEIGVWRNGVFYLDFNGSGTFTVDDDLIVTFGAAGATPIVGRW